MLAIVKNLQDLFAFLTAALRLASGTVFVVAQFIARPLGKPESNGTRSLRSWPLALGKGLCYTASVVARRNFKTLAKVFEYELPIRVSKGNGRFFAACPIWDDCYAQSDTVEDVINEIVAVAASLIGLYQEEELEIPLKKSPRVKLIQQQMTVKVPVLVSA